MSTGWVGFRKAAWGVELLPDEQSALASFVGQEVTVTRRSMDGKGPAVTATGIVHEIQLRTDGPDSRVYERFLTLSI